MEDKAIRILVRAGGVETWPARGAAVQRAEGTERVRVHARDEETGKVGEGEGRKRERSRVGE